jgi:uncharacterized protein YutE (UPF0331/DUF86 family)/predicted nucleotidyltransferase
MPFLEDEPTERLSRAARESRGLRLLVLFGSRARGEDHPQSDWDVGYLARADLDADALLGNVVRALGTDRVDLIDLGRASRPVSRRRRGASAPRRRRSGVSPLLARGGVVLVRRRARHPGRVRRGARRPRSMSALDRELLAERAMVVRRHLRRVAERLPPDPSDLRPATDASDAVILHLWQAVQVVIDLAVTGCLHFDLGAPRSYADAFRRLTAAGVIEAALAERLARAAGFPNVVAHAYEDLDMARVFRAARDGPADLLAFLAALRDRMA